MKKIDPGASQAGFKGRNSGLPLRIAGIYGEGTSSSSFLGVGRGNGALSVLTVILLEKVRPFPPGPLPGILIKGVLFWGSRGFPLAGLDSITRSFSPKKNDLE